MIFPLFGCREMVENREEVEEFGQKLKIWYI